MVTLLKCVTAANLAPGRVVCLRWVVLRLLRSRLQPRAKPGAESDDMLRYVRALQLGAKERVVLVEHRGERWMLGVTAGGISTLAHWPKGAPVVPADSPPAG